MWTTEHGHHSVDGGVGWDRSSANVFIVHCEAYVGVVVGWVGNLGGVSVLCL